MKELEGVNVRQISAGENHSACATDTGKLITFGTKEREKSQQEEWRKTDFKSDEKRLKQETSSFLVSFFTLLFTFFFFFRKGCGLFGQLGISENVNRLTPAMVRFAPHEKHVDIKSVVCGANHTSN